MIVVPHSYGIHSSQTESDPLITKDANNENSLYSSIISKDYLLCSSDLASNEPNDHDIISRKYSKNVELDLVLQDSQKAFITFLMHHSNHIISIDVAKNIVSFLPFQPQLLFFDPFTFKLYGANAYPVIDFCVLIFGVIIHFFVAWFAFYAMLILPFIESILILVIYYDFYGNFHENKVKNLLTFGCIQTVEFRNMHEYFVIFYAYLHTVLEFFIYIPMITILLFAVPAPYWLSSQSYIAITTYFVAYFVITIYKTYIHFLRCKYLNITSDSMRNMSFRSVYLYYLLHLIILNIYAMMYWKHTLVICAIATAFYLSIFVAHFVDRKNFLLLFKNLKFLFMYLLLNCVHNIIFSVFAIYHYWYHDTTYSKLCIIVATLEAILIYVQYIIPTHVYFIRKSRSFLRSSFIVAMELLVHIPFTILMFYYLFTATYYVPVWYLCIAGYILHDSLFIIISYLENEKANMMKLPFIVNRVPIVALIFGIIFIRMTNASHYIWTLSVASICFGSISICCADILPGGFFAVLYFEMSKVMRRQFEDPESISTESRDEDSSDLNDSD